MSSRNSSVAYKVEWLYSDLPADKAPPDPERFALHFSFLIRFANVPRGPGHATHFCFNVLSRSVAAERGISAPSRGYIVMEPFHYGHVITAVEDAVSNALSKHSRDEAVNILNTLYICRNIDASEEFAADLLDGATIVEMVNRAFDGVERGAGITLHEAIVIDDYGDDEERQKARALDHEQRWQDVPDADIASSPSYLTFLDAAGYRYYLPANMSLALRNHADDWNDCTHRTYLSLLPIVAPRDVGQGLGEKFDVQDFIRRFAFTSDQVRAIYRFLCFMAVQAGLGVSEDQYPAMLKWKMAALH